MVFLKRILFLLILSYLVINVVYKNDYVVIPSNSIRMRVIASSNNLEDIKNKKIIKKSLEKELVEVAKTSNSYKEADYKLKNSYDTVNSIIEKSMKDNNIKEKYTINYGYNYFPEKKKGGVIYKAGNYKSYVVTLGKGEGSNFWCVLFPPLCLVDEKNTNNYSFLIKEILSDYTS